MAAIVGEAHVIVRAITSGVEKDIKRAFDQSGPVGHQAGRTAGKQFRKGVNDSFKEPFITERFRRDAEDARLKLRRLTIAGYFAVPAITALAGAIGALIQGLTAFITVVSRASQSAIVLVASLAAIGQGAIAAKIGVGGVGNALKAADKAAKDSAGNNRALERAIRRVEDARIALRNAIDQEAPERLAQARERAVEAEERAADALLSSERALRTYNKAQQRTQQALDGLNDARDRAREKIQQLRFEVEGGAISEKRARLEFEKARDSLQRVQDLPPNSRARQEAELAFASADLNLRKAIDRNSDLKKEEQAATQAGVEGSQEVVSARQAISDAIEAERDALLNAAKAQRDATKAREAANKAAEDASAGGSAEKENLERIAQTRRALKDAQEDLADLQKKGGDDGLEKALERLSPAAREFVKRFQEVKDEFLVLRFAVQEPLFKEVNKSLETVVDNIENFEPMLASTGVVLGDIVKGFTETFFEAENFGKLQGVWGTSNTLLGNFGKTLENLYVTLLNLLTAAEPLTLKFGEWIETLTGRWATNTGNDIDGLTERFNTAGELVGKVVDIFKELNRGFRAVGEAAMEEGGAVQILLGYLENTFGAWADLKEAELASGVLGDRLAQGTTNFTLLLTILGSITKALTDLGSTENFGAFLGSIDEAVGNFAGIGGIVDNALPAFGEFIVKLSELFLVLGESESFTIFFNTLSRIIEALITFLEIPIVQQLFMLLVQVFAMAKAFGLAARVLKFFGLAFAGNILKPFKMGRDGISRYRKAVRAAGGVTSAVAQGFRKVSLLFDGPRLRLMLFKDWVVKQMPVVRAAFQRFGAGIRNIFSSIGNVFRTFLTDLRNAFRMIFDGLRNALTRAFTTIRGFIGRATQFIGRALIALKGKILLALNAIKGAVVKALLALGKAMLAALPWIIIIVALIAIIVLIVKNWDKIKEVVRKAMDWVKEKITSAWENIKEKTKEVLQKVAEFFGNLWDRVKEVFNRIKDWIRDNHPMLVLLRFVREKWPEVKNWFTERIDMIVNFFSGIKDRIKEKVSGMWDGLKDAFKNALNWIIDKWNNFKIEARIPDNIATRGLGLAGRGFTLETPNIPRLALGGIVPAIRGGTLAILGEGGRSERVEPLDSDGLSTRDKAMIKFMTSSMPGGGGPTINVYPSPGMDERELADLVSRRLASQMRAGGI